MRDLGTLLIMSGFAGAGLTLWLGLVWAPSVSIDAFEAPISQKIFYWHVPSAWACLLYTSPSPRDMRRSRMPSSA